MNGEKNNVILGVQKPAQRRPWVLGGLLLLGIAWLATHPLRKINPPTCWIGAQGSFAADEFDWEKVIPSETLNWHPCYEAPFTCARLSVPLNYAHPHGEKAAIALIRYPSKYSHTDKRWRGPVLYNPGGPGGSGVDTIHARGANMSRIVGDEFDHIGFDPRGIGRTTPQLNLFPTAAERKMWDLTSPPPINSTTDALARVYARANILGDLAAERQPHVARHMSTAIVARDMLQITRAHGRDKLLYWGFSYGTVLGITYASMFPHNIERLIVDGVVDTYNYYEGAWSNNLLDTDKDLGMVLSSCAKSSACGLHAKSASLVGDRLVSILDGLKTRPVPVTNGSSSYGIVDYGVARALLFGALYRPATAMPALFQAFAALESGDPDPIWRLSAQRNDSAWRCPCDGGGRSALNGLGETTFAIACGDATPVEVDLDRLQDDYERIFGYSSFADVWPIHAVCAGWKLRPVERFSGKFGGNTSHPLLLIGNVADPVTPLWAAHKMAKGFKDAVVLTQHSAGHCSTSSASLCTAKIVREYFIDGTLPEKGTVCEVEDHIFEPDDDKVVNLYTAEEEEIMRAARGLRDGWVIPPLGALM